MGEVVNVDQGAPDRLTEGAARYSSSIRIRAGQSSVW
jgi:hypothetical protein